MNKTHILTVLCASFIGLQCSDANPTSTESTTESTTTSTLPAVFSKFISAVETSADGSFVVIEAKGVPNHTSPYWGSGHTLYEAPHTGMVVNPNSIS